MRRKFVFALLLALVSVSAAHSEYFSHAAIFNFVKYGTEQDAREYAATVREYLLKNNTDPKTQSFLKKKMSKQELDAIWSSLTYQYDPAPGDIYFGWLIEYTISYGLVIRIDRINENGSVDFSWWPAS